MAKLAVATDNRGVSMAKDYGSAEALHIGAHEGNVPPTGADESENPELKFFMQLGLDISSSMANQNALNKKILNNLENTPISFAAATSGVFPSTGSLLLTLGTPDLGTKWEVAFAAIGGADINVSIAGIAGLYVTGSQNATGGIPNLQDYASSLPNVGFYGTRQMAVNDREYLMAVIFNGTPGSTYYAAAQFTVTDNAAAGGKVVAVD